MSNQNNPPVQPHHGTDTKEVAVAQHDPTTATKPKRDAGKRLDYVKFHRACEALKERKEELLDKRPSRPKTAELLSTMLGFPVSAGTVGDLQEATGIKWESRGGTTKEGAEAEKHLRMHQIRTLATALHALYRKLGEEVPSTLEDLYRYHRGGPIGQIPEGKTTSNGAHVEDRLPGPRCLQTARDGERVRQCLRVGGHQGDHSY